MSSKDEKLDRAIGAIVGSAIGDTFGAPLEFKQPRPFHQWQREITGGGSFNWRKGEITDDTIMANGITQMYLREGRYHQHTVVREWLNWLSRGPKDIGSWTASALYEWRKLIGPASSAWDRHGIRDDYHPAIKLWKARGLQDAGNGGVMRCVPTALAVPRQRDRMRETRWLCEDTHPDPRCIWSCIAVVETCALLIQNPSYHVMSSIAHLFDAKPQGFDIPWIAQKQAFLNETLDAVEKCHRPWEEWSNSGYTIGTINSAFNALEQAESFEDGLVQVVNRGNDADSVGAVAGAMLGAKFGFSNIPSRWFNALEDHDMYVENAKNLFLNIRSKRQ